MAWELWLGNGCEFLDDVLQGLQAGHPQLVAVVSGSHECHPDKVRQMEYQEVILEQNRKNYLGTSEI